MNCLKLSVSACLIVLSILACSFPAAASRAAARRTPTPTPAAIQILPRPALSTPAARATGTLVQTQEPPPGQTVAAATPTTAPPSCLEGSWNITNLESAILAVIPADMIQSYDLQFKEKKGSALLVISPGNRITLRADGLQLVYTAKVTFFRVPLIAAINGEAAGSYQLDGNTLTTRNMNAAGLSATVQLAGKDLVDPAVIAGAIPLVQPPLNTASFTCLGDTLQLKLTAYGDSVPALVFQRAN